MATEPWLTVARLSYKYVVQLLLSRSRSSQMKLFKYFIERKISKDSRAGPGVGWLSGRWLGRSHDAAVIFQVTALPDVLRGREGCWLPSHIPGRDGTEGRYKCVSFYQELFAFTIQSGILSHRMNNNNVVNWHINNLFYHLSVSLHN